MSIDSTKAEIINQGLPNLQQTQLGTEIQNMQVGVGFTLPTSDPGVAGYLWSDSGTVKVSAG
ncbi:MAG: hypothetical protein PVF17_00755 [Ignavibacteria bacterium]|jgi:hypothetical protein